MNKNIKELLIKKGYNVNPESRTITATLSGINKEIEVALDYELFNSATLEELDAVEDFFPNRQEILEQAEKDFVQANLNNSFDFLSGNLQELADDCKDEISALKVAFEEANGELIRDIFKLSFKTITTDKFYDFVNDLSCIGYSNHVAISSIYSPHITRVLTKDDLYDGIGIYMEKLIERKELILDGFNVWDDFYADVVCEKFDLYDNYEEE